MPSLVIHESRTLIRSTARRHLSFPVRRPPPLMRRACVSVYTFTYADAIAVVLRSSRSFRRGIVHARCSFLSRVLFRLRFCGRKTNREIILVDRTRATESSASSPARDRVSSQAAATATTMQRAQDFLPAQIERSDRERAIRARHLNCPLPRGNTRA